MKTKHFPAFFTWIVASILIHVALLLLPVRLLEVLFPQAEFSLDENPSDLTPHFAEMAMEIIPIPPELMGESFEARVLEIEEEPFPSIIVMDRPRREASDGLLSNRHPQFFPPLPRLIVPPTVEDLQVVTIRVDLRILVGTDGVPRRILIADSLGNQEVRRRILECARRFRFEPARRGGLPVAAWIDLPLVLESAAAK